MTKREIKYTEPPHGSFPVQAEGYVDGRPFYFRARGGMWSLEVGRNNQTPDELHLGIPRPLWVAEGTGDPDMDPAEADAIIRDELSRLTP